MTQPPSEPGVPQEGSDPGASGPFVPPAAPAADATPSVPQGGGYPPPPGSGYPPPPSGLPPATGFPPPQSNYPPPPPPNYGPPQGNFPPPPQGNYPPSPGFPPPGQGQGGYPPPAQQGNYPPPPSQGGYPPPAPQGGYGQPPAQQGGYGPPPGPGGYPQPGQGYGPPPGQGGFPPQPGQGGFPPQGQGGFPPGQQGGAPSIDLSKVGTGDWVVIGLGALLLVFSFFNFASVSYSFTGISESFGINGWSRFWFLAPLLALVVTVIYAVQVLTGSLRKEVKPLWLLYAALAALVIYLISLIDAFIQTSGADFDLGLDDSSVSAGPGFGIWASIILAIAFVYFLALQLQAKGEKLPLAIPGPKL